ncbi:MAG: efflux RND transporter permease subunit [Myxococcales bacterium]|nr:efflux RND transporter permease subunit [Myxococcales bacterium]
MTLSDISIQRPVFTWMMTLALIVFGVLGYNRLGVDQFPNMEFPVLTITAVLPGASPEAIEEDVVDVIEEQVSTLSGVRSVRSTSYQDACQIVVEFVLGTDLDLMAQQVRDVIGRVRGQLPPEMEPPVVGNFNPNESPVLWFPLETDRSIAETTDFANRQLSPFIETIPGVAGLEMFGARDRNIRIWLDGDALRARGLSSGDVIRAIGREHVEIPGGVIESGRVEYSVKTDAEFRTLAELEELVIAHEADALVLLRDVARIEDGAEDVKTIAHFNGRPAIAMGVMRKSGENTVAIVDEVFHRLPEIRAILPDGMRIADPAGWVDFSKGVREAVAETEFALVFGALLAILVVFIFLRRTRPTLIVMAAIPISLIATFGLVWIFGYTLNTMTLLGMTLAVGVVIDDAIVVLENIERHRDQGASAREAASAGTRQIAFAATAATICVAAVFLPVVFIEGLVGSFLSEFGLTVAGSVLISLFVALTLTPMLAARMPPPSERAHGSVYHRLEVGFEAFENFYRRVLHWTLAHRAITVGGAVGSFALALVFGFLLEGEFFPPSDTGIFFAQLEAAPGTSIDATLEYLEKDEQYMLSQPELVGMFSSAGAAGGHSVPLSHTGMIFGMLSSVDERERTVFEVIDAARKELGKIPGRDVRLFAMGENMSSRPGNFDIEIRGHLPLDELDALADRFMTELEAKGGFVDLDKSLKLGLPELRVVLDRKKAAVLGVSARTVATTVQAMVGGIDVGVFKEAGRRYDIRMRLEAADRAEPEAILSLYVRNDRGEVVELRNLVEIQLGAAPSAITRTNRQRSVSISGNFSEDRKLGQTLIDAEEIAGRILPQGVTMIPAGSAEIMQEGMAQFGIAVGLAILVIYMVLAAQFESLVHPFTVMLALPLAMVGALGGLLVTGNTINLFSLIGILLLFGLVTKNSILLVDYANQLRREGMDKVEAMRTAAPVRMRPVLMTALSMIFGVLPAALGLGPGAESRAPMAIATAAGMLSSTVLTLLVVPVFYLVFDDAAEAVTRFFGRLTGGHKRQQSSAIS